MKKLIKKLLLAVVSLLTLQGTLKAEDVWLEWCGRDWYVVRKQMTGSNYPDWRNPDNYIGKSHSLPRALEMAFYRLPHTPTGQRNNIWVRNVRTFAQAGPHRVDLENQGKANLRDRANVVIDFEHNELVTVGGPGAFIFAARCPGLQIRHLTIHSNPRHSGSHVIQIDQTGGANIVIENFRCFGNSESGIAVRANGTQNVNYMWGLHFRGDLKFSGGHGGKHPIETFTVADLRIGHVFMNDMAAGICINDGAHVTIDRVDATRISPTTNRNYAVVRFANNCKNDITVHRLHTHTCGRALASTTSPSLGLQVGWMQAYDCTERGVLFTEGTQQVYLWGGEIYGGAPDGGIQVAGRGVAHIQNFNIGWIRGNGVTLQGHDSQLHRSTVRHCDGWGVVTQGWNCHVTESRIHNNGGGIQVRSGGGNHIKDTWIFSNRTKGIEIWDSASWTGIWRSFTWDNPNFSTNRSSSTIVRDSGIEWR
jgi:hypothetical protein